MKLPVFISNIIKLINKQHILLKVVIAIALTGCMLTFTKWFQWTLGQQMYALEPFSTGGKKLVLFHWKDCGHCKTMMPEWKKLKSQYQGNIKLEDYESTANPQIMKDNGVQGYPTIRYYNNGTKEEYSGGRTAEEFIKFLNSK